VGSCKCRQYKGYGTERARRGMLGLKLGPGHGKLGVQTHQAAGPCFATNMRNASSRDNLN
jgi:hypothetical protein